MMQSPLNINADSNAAKLQKFPLLGRRKVKRLQLVENIFLWVYLM